MGVKVREKDKGSGDWWIFINHKTKRKAIKIGRDKKVALAKAKQIEARLILDKHSLDKDKEEKVFPVFAEYADIWINVTVPATCKESTKTDYTCILIIHIIPFFGKKQIIEINRMVIKNFLMMKIKDGYSPSTVSHMKCCISGILNIAVDNGDLDSNPAHRLGKLYKKGNVQDKIDPYSKQELSHLLKGFKEWTPDHYPLMLTLARTGMRIGEVFALQWDDINFEKSSIKVQRTYYRRKVGTPKNGKSRIVDMSNQLSGTLIALRNKREAEVAKNGLDEIPVWIFPNKDGNLADSDHWRRRVFYTVIEKTGLRKIRIHDIRHTYASLLIQAGESLAYIRDQLGHHSISITVDTYGHLTPGANKAAVDRLDD